MSEHKNENLVVWTSLSEAGVEVQDQKKKKIKLRLIKAGRSQRGNYYSPEVLQEAAPMFKGVKMYIDHPEEQKVNLPRSLRDWGGTILESVYDPNDQAIIADVGIRDPWLWGLIEAGKQEDWLNEIGASINAAGPTVVSFQDGKKTNVVEGIKLIRSVDFVPEASAGGQVQSVLESKQFGQEDGTMELTLQELLDQYPKLVEAVQDTTLEVAMTDPEFAKTFIESAMKNKMMGSTILEAIAGDESAMTIMIEGIEAARTEQLGYNFTDLEEAISEQNRAMEQMQSALTALRESADKNGNIDLAAFEKQVREDEAAYWHGQYKESLKESAAGDPELARGMQALQEQVKTLTVENDQLRGDFATIISKATAMSMLKESGLPQAACDRLLPHMIDKTESEMEALIEDKRHEIASIVGTTAVKGGSIQRPSVTDLKESAQKRIDGLFGYSDVIESKKPEQSEKKQDLSHLE